MRHDDSTVSVKTQARRLLVMNQPLKPSLATVHPRLPRPKTQRGVQCPRCDFKFSISRKAMSVRCPKCTHPLRLEDFDLDSKVHRDLNTMGEVIVRPTSELVGNIHCAHFVNQGKYAGKARVYGRIILSPASITRGTLIGQNLQVLFGATVRGKAMIGPAGRILTPAEKVQRQQRQQQQQRQRLRVISAKRLTPVRAAG